MKSGKRVVGILIVSLLLIVSISFVSATWKDWFGFGNKDKNLEGELPQAAPASVVLQDVTSVPVVVFVSNVYGGAGVNQVQPNLRNGPAAGNVNVSFSFVAQVGGDEGKLDVIPGSRGNATAILTSSGENPRSNMSCTTMAMVAWPPGSPTYHGANYSCTVVMRYYDAPGTNTWNINATVRDPSNGNKASNLTKPFSVLNNQGATISTSYLNWTNPILTTLTTNRPSDNTPNLTNDGNIAWTSLSINATYLNGTDKPAEAINPGNFSVNNVNDCLGTQLQPYEDIGPSTFNAPRTTSETLSQTNFYICLKGPLSGLTSQTYKSAILTPWDLKIS